MQAATLKPDNAKAIVILVAGLVAVIVIVVFLNKTFGGIAQAFGSVTDALGITDSEATKANKQAVANAQNQAASTGSPWSPQFYKSAPSGSHIMTQATADALALEVWNSVGIFSTSIEDVYAAMKQLGYQTQISFLADRFNALYNKDLFSWLTLQYTKMGTPDPVLSTIIDYVNSLPRY